MTIDLPSDARARLDAHLDAVEQALAAAGRSREQRRSIVDDLETQILDMLASRTATPALADLMAVLSTLDPPAAYESPSDSPSHSSQEIAREPPPAAAIPNSSSSIATQPISSFPIAVKPPAKRSFFMKSSVLIALIVCGTLLLMTPAIADHFKDVQNQAANQQLVSILAARTDLNNIQVDIHRPYELPDMMKMGLWLSGSLTILAGVVGGFVAYESEKRS